MVLISAAVLPYAFLVVELLREVLEKESREEDGEEGGEEGYEEGGEEGEEDVDSDEDGNSCCRRPRMLSDYDDKDEIALVKRALGIRSGHGRRKRLDCIV